MIVGMPAAGPEAHLLDREAVSVKPLSRALGFLLQELVLCKETLSVFCFGSFFSNASPRPTICQSRLLDTFQEEPGMGEVMGRNPNVSISAVSLPSGWPMSVYSASLSRPQSPTSWGERRQEGCGNDLVLCRKSSVCPT